MQNDLLLEQPSNEINSLDGQGFKHLVEASLIWLKSNQQIVNALNVFPVPDGDTGTNMVLTMQSACEEITNSSEKNIGKVAHAVAQGALMGARGNSGVILSQLWRGFARGLDSMDTMDAKLFVRSLVEARDTAYKGVVRPVEGTILTVATEVALGAQEILEETQDIKSMLEKLVIVADRAVKRTPELLPILKQAGVVDSGGKGLYFILEGMLRYLNNEPLDTPVANVQPISNMLMEESMETIEPGQDYEVVIDFQPGDMFNLEKFYLDLSDMGTSIQLGEGDGMYRLHIHVPTEKRYKPIDYTMDIGTITKVYIENLIIQMEKSNKNSKQQLELADVKPGQIAVIAVSPGPGISRIFASLGIAGIVEGGQTMNPSTKEILESFENMPTDQIIILPNNKNIVLAAQSAASGSKKQVAVIPCTSIPQGLNAALRLTPDGDFNNIVKSMNDSLKEVITGEITVATRSVDINGVSVKEGEVIALLNGQLIQSAHTIEESCLSLLEKAGTDEMERITFFYGNNISSDEIDKVINLVRKKYPSHEIEIHDGGQPHYQFIIAIE